MRFQDALDLAAGVLLGFADGFAFAFLAAVGQMNGFLTVGSDATIGLPLFLAGERGKRVSESISAGCLD